MPPFVGICACRRRYPDYLQHAVPEQYVAAARMAGTLPVLVPAIGGEALALLDRLDGLLLSGSESNVSPERYGAETAADQAGWHDPARDSTTLPLLLAALERDMPVLAICRGHQELNVALGGTLHQAVHQMPGRMDHREDQALAGEAQWQACHPISLSGQLAALLGGSEIAVNSLHGQAVDRLGERLLVEAWAADGTVEAVRVEGCSFAYGVQWHPERGLNGSPAGSGLVKAFGDACRRHAGQRTGTVCLALSVSDAAS